jgi:hypothetical protein
LGACDDVPRPRSRAAQIPSAGEPVSDALGQGTRRLGDDIRANGQVETVKLHSGMVLDGRNRYTACGRQALASHGSLYGTDREALAWVISKTSSAGI